VEGSSYSVCSSCNQAHILSTTSTSPHSTNTAIIIPSPPIQCTNTRPPPLPVHPLKMDDLFSTQARFAFFPPPCQLFLTHWHPQTSLFLRSAPWNPPPKKQSDYEGVAVAGGGSGSGISPSQESVGWLFFGVSNHVLGRKIADFLLSSSTRLYTTPPPPPPSSGPPANLTFPLFLFPQRPPKAPFYCEK